MAKPKLVISSGAGISAESGITTFRDAGGLWENYPVMEVASADGFRRNPELVHQFYNARRHDLISKSPNGAHKALVELEKDYDVDVITQNVDDLHERAGSSRVLHLHGELMKIRSVTDPDYIETLDPTHLDTMELAEEADIFVVIGTSLAVYPAAGLMQCVRPGVPVYYIDPNPATSAIHRSGVNVIKATATEGMKKLMEILRKKS